MAKKIGSSQSQVAKMEAGDRSATIDLLVRSLIAALDLFRRSRLRGTVSVCHLPYAVHWRILKDDNAYHLFVEWLSFFFLLQ